MVTAQLDTPVRHDDERHLHDDERRTDDAALELDLRLGLKSERSTAHDPAYTARGESERASQPPHGSRPARRKGPSGARCRRQRPGALQHAASGCCLHLSSGTQSIGLDRWCTTAAGIPATSSRAARHTFQRTAQVLSPQTRGGVRTRRRPRGPRRTHRVTTPMGRTPSSLLYRWRLRTGLSGDGSPISSATDETYTIWRLGGWLPAPGHGR